MKKQALGSLIVSKTIMFIAIIILVSVFGIIFGDDNRLLGVTTIVLILVFLDRNFTVNPIQKFVSLLGANLIFGLSAYLVPLNLWIGLVLNLIVVFSFTYFSTFELRKSLTMTIGLHYLLLLAAPIEAEGLPLRFAALAIGPVLIMATQFLLNRGKVAKTGPKTFEMLQSILEESLTSGHVQAEQAQAIIGRFKITVYDAIPKGQMPNAYQGAWLNLTSHFEYLFELLQRESAPLSSDLSTALQEALHMLKTGDSSGEWRVQWAAVVPDSPFGKQLTSVLEGIAFEQTQIAKSDSELAGERLPDEFSAIHLARSKMNLSSIRLRYALRLSLLFSLLFFFADYYDMPYWSWMLYAVFFVSQPYIEYSFTRAKKRAVGTLIGAIIVLVAFTFIEDPTQRTLLILLSGYLASYMIDYQNIIIFVTISTVASSALNEADPGAFVLVRVLWTGGGIILALIANSLLFKTSYTDEATQLDSLKTDIETYAYRQTFLRRASAGLAHYFYTISAFLADRISMSNHDRLLEGASLHQRRLMYLVQLQAYRELDPETYQSIVDILIKDTPIDVKRERLSALSVDANAVRFTMVSQALELVES